MKKTYKLIDLDCAACGAKIENAIKKMNLIDNASVSFIAQKLSIETNAEGEELKNLEKEIKKLISRVEPDCQIVL